MTDQPVALTSSTIVARSDRQLWSHVGDETVLMHLDTGGYFGCDAIGTRIWSMIEEPTTIATLCERLVGVYAVEPERCASDLYAFVRELVSEGLATAQPRPNEW